MSSYTIYVEPLQFSNIPDTVYADDQITFQLAGGRTASATINLSLASALFTNPENFTVTTTTSPTRTIASGASGNVYDISSTTQEGWRDPMNGSIKVGTRTR